MQACLGATYSWAVFVPALRKLTGLGQGAVQMPFTLFYIVFPATALFAGMVMARLGPRRSAVLGGAVFGLGWIFAGLGAKGFLFTVAGIGVLGGLGVGMAYVVPIATCIQWFPRHKGLVTGIAVAGFGGGAAAVSQCANLLMIRFGSTPYETFRVLGGVYVVLICLAGLVMRSPSAAGESSPMAGETAQNDQDASSSASSSGAPSTAPSGAPTTAPSSAAPAASTSALPRVRFGEIIRERHFQVLYLAMVFGLAAGFLVSANLKQLSAAATAQAGVAAVSLFALANALGRVLWGALFDRMHSPKRAIQANLALQAVLVFAAPWLLRSTAGLQLVAVAAGFNYGGVLVLYASSVASRWGSQRVGYIYGWLFSANIPAALAPALAGFAYDRLGSFTYALAACGALLVAGVWVVQAEK